MRYRYECKRKNVIERYHVDGEEYHIWKEISAELIETNVGVMTPLTEIIGYFEPERTTEYLEEQLAAGKVIELNNFYVRRKVSA